MSSAAPTLRHYQTAALEAIEKGLLAGRNRLLVKKPTGTGKTIMFAAMPSQMGAWLAQFPATERRMLVIAHREELLDQAVAKIQAANPHLVVMVEQGDRMASPYADVVVASIQTLSAMKFRRLERLLARMVFRLVIVDEAHHAAARTYRTVLARLGFLPLVTGTETGDEIEAVNFDDEEEMLEALKAWDQTAPRDRLLVGVTATPNRSDAIGLSCVFQDLCFSYELRKAITDGWLVPPVPLVLSTDVNLDGVKTTAGDFNQKQLAEAVNTAARNAVAVKGWLDHAKGRSTLAFTVDVEHAHVLASMFQEVGVRAEALSGETPREDRQRMLRQYTDGQIDILANCMVLTEGTDLPRTSCILHAKPTKSATLYEQMTGRGLRLYPGKADCLVLDIVDVTKRHSLQTTPVLFGLPTGLIPQGKPIDQIADEWDTLKQQYPYLEQLLKDTGMTLEQLKVQAKTFDIWTVLPLGPLAASTSMQWMCVGPDVYQMRYPWGEATETVQVSTDLLGKWEVTCTLRPANGEAPRQRTIAHGIPDPQLAASMAEGYVRDERQSVQRLTDKNAPWRSKPASEKQLALLKRRRVPVPTNCTMGQASELIDRVMNARRGPN